MKITFTKLHKSLRYLNQRCVQLPLDGRNKDSGQFSSAPMNNNVTSKPPIRKSVTDHVLKGGNFYCPFDKEVLSKVKSYYNNVKGLITICIPAFCSLVLTAASMVLYQTMVSCLWPVTGRPDINTAITCFLAPAGLVYALSFGFTFQQALEKHRSVLGKVRKAKISDISCNGILGALVLYQNGIYCQFYAQTGTGNQHIQCVYTI